MNKTIDEWYAATRKMIDEFSSKDDRQTIEHLITEWQTSIDTMEADFPDIRENYERRKSMQDSFSGEQVAHICYQIGEWYIEWKDKIWVDDKPNQHRLGIAKEKLKIMICGE